jgi:hypothetical protein
MQRGEQRRNSKISSPHPTHELLLIFSRLCLVGDLDHDPERWIPGSRLREALPIAIPYNRRYGGSKAGWEKIMFKQQAKAK